MERAVGKLGKLPARANAIQFKFAQVFNVETLPQAPSGPFGHYANVSEAKLGMLGNDQYGCCVWSGAGHEEMMWSREGGSRPINITTENVLSDYAAATGFNPNDPLSDRGTDIQKAAEYRRTTGIIDSEGNRHTVDAYVAISLRDWKQLRLATYLFGAVGVGIIITQSAEDQFKGGHPWSSVYGRELGGHYIPCVGFNSAGLAIVETWGRYQGMTQRFYECMSDEAIAYISLETLDEKGLSPEQFDRERLEAMLTDIGG